MSCRPCVSAALIIWCSALFFTSDALAHSSFRTDTDDSSRYPDHARAQESPWVGAVRAPGGTIEVDGRLDDDVWRNAVSGWGFLEMEPDRSYGAVYISKYYPGATPRDVQKEILIPVENALESLDGVKKLHTDAFPSRAKIKVEASKGTDIRILKDDIESLLKTISTIPAPNEPFKVSAPTRSDHRSVIWVVVTGDLPQEELLSIARHVREDLLTIDGISRVREFLPRNRKVSIEVDVGKLAAYDLSFQEVSNAIRQYSVDLPAGSIEGVGGAKRNAARQGFQYGARHMQRTDLGDRGVGHYALRGRGDHYDGERALRGGKRDERREARRERSHALGEHVAHAR